MTEDDVAGHSIRSMAVLLGRSASTISREIKRNDDQGCYRAPQADLGRLGSGTPPQELQAGSAPNLGIVASKLQSQWSPEQIAGWLKHTYPCDGNYHVSHETIYRTRFIQARGA